MYISKRTTIIFMGILLVILFLWMSKLQSGYEKELLDALCTESILDPNCIGHNVE